MLIDLNLLLDYTDWQRQKWHNLLRQHGDQILRASVGPNRDARFETIGDLLRHIFSAEKRYIERLSNKPLTDTSSIPTDSSETIFQFGQQSRAALREFIDTFPSQNWDIPEEHKMPGAKAPLTLTPRKIIIHVVLHEIRHWAQIATLLRLDGVKSDFQDFLFSPILGANTGHGHQGR